MNALRREPETLTVPMAPTAAFEVKRALKFLCLYSTVLTMGFWLAYQLRFDFEVPLVERRHMPYFLAGVVLTQLLFLFAFRQFHLLPSYFGIPAFLRMFGALLCSALVLGIARAVLGLGYALPFGVICLNVVLALVLLTGLCSFWRLYRHDRMFLLLAGFCAPDKRKRRVGIVGAGDTGQMLAQELQGKPHLGLQPVVFFDDDVAKWKARLQEVPVLGPPELLLRGIARRYRLDEIILSMPSAPARRVREILGVLRQTGLNHRTVPSLAELAAGKFKVSHLRTVQIEDLLGREPVSLHTEEIRRLINGRRVMVTGAGGSIGRELSRQVASYDPASLLLIERSEAHMFQVEQELIRRGYRHLIRPLVANILDEPRMRRIFENFRPQLIFHAAAHKHVPMMESQPDEAIQNNTFGTALVARLALELGAERFVLISTDKAINPKSVMGATKRLAEMVLQDLQARNHTLTKLVAVRFGNVLGSSGSVVPLFQDQIAAGGPVTVTHPQMTRYFMTIPEAVGLVLQTTVLGQGGEIFVLDMGKPVPILELARQMIQLYGFEPGKDIAIEFTGIRPGEKLFEEISYTQESVTPTRHPKILRLRGSPPRSSLLREHLELLRSALRRGDASELKGLLQQAVPEYLYLEPDAVGEGIAA